MLVKMFVDSIYQYLLSFPWECKAILRLDAVSLLIDDHLQPLWQALAQRFYLKVCIDILADALKASFELGDGFIPGFSQLCQFFSPPDPGHSCLMKRNLLQTPWLD